MLRFGIDARRRRPGSSDHSLLGGLFQTVCHGQEQKLSAYLILMTYSASAALSSRLFAAIALAFFLSMVAGISIFLRHIATDRFPGNVRKT